MVGDQRGGLCSSGADRARRRLADMVNVDGDSLAGAAAEFGVGWHTVNQAVATFTDPHIDDPDRLEGVETIGVDEKRFLNATPERRTVYTTQIVDLDRHRLLDVVEGRSRDVLDRWLTERGDDWCDRIRLAPWTPPPDTVRPPKSISRTPLWWWSISMRSGWPTRPSTMSAVGSNNKPWGTVDARPTRCIGRDGSC